MSIISSLGQEIPVEADFICQSSSTFTKLSFFPLDEHTHRNLFPCHSFAFSGEELPAPHLCYLEECRVPIHSLLTLHSTLYL